MNWKWWDKSSEIGALLALLRVTTQKVGRKHTTSKYGHDAVREARKAER